MCLRLREYERLQGADKLVVDRRKKVFSPHYYEKSFSELQCNVTTNVLLSPSIKLR